MSYLKFITIKTFKTFEALLKVQNPFQNSSQKLRHYFIPITYFGRVKNNGFFFVAAKKNRRVSFDNFCMFYYVRNT